MSSSDTVHRHKLITSSELARTGRKAGLLSPTSQSQTSVSSSIAIVSFSSPNVSIKANDPIKSKDSLIRQSSDVPLGLASRTSSASLVDGLGSSQKSNRFNPFNRSSDNSENSCSNTTVESENISVASSSSLDTSLAELGLTEDYFSHPEGHLRLYSADEIEIAIDQCKEMILKAPENSAKRKKLVKNLVDLRLRLQDIRDGPDAAEPKSKHILGHRLRKKSSRSMKHHCDCCSNLIWGMIQVWYKCRECGFSCHSKCVNNIRRTCVMLSVKNNVSYTLKICPEVGLSKQQYCCAECKNHIEITGSDEARMCDYSGLYYCANCHWNDSHVMPARVLHNWDHTSYKVSRQALQLLQVIYNRPLLDIQEINPLLFNYVEELSEIRKMREDILKMKLYFLTCSKALELKLLWKLHDRQHFVDGSRMYSMKDLVEAKSGSLTTELAEIHTSFAKHIKLDCPFCQAKGFICEICNSGETLFPFDVMVSICPRCSAVFHVDCFSCVDTMCPRCKRKQSKRLASFSISMSSDEEYNAAERQNGGDDDEDSIYGPSRTSSLLQAAARATAEAKTENLTPDTLQMKARADDGGSAKQSAVSPFTAWIASQREQKAVASESSDRDKLLGRHVDVRPLATNVDHVSKPARWRDRDRVEKLDSDISRLVIDTSMQGRASPTTLADGGKSSPAIPKRDSQPDVIKPDLTSAAHRSARNLMPQAYDPTSISDFVEYNDVSKTSLNGRVRHVERGFGGNNPFLDDESETEVETPRPHEKREKFNNPFLDSGDEGGTNPFGNVEESEYDREKNPFYS